MCLLAADGCCACAGSRCGEQQSSGVLAHLRWAAGTHTQLAKIQNDEEAPVPQFLAPPDITAWDCNCG
jgi:hypothetical protein